MQYGLFHPIIYLCAQSNLKVEFIYRARVGRLGLFFRLQTISAHEWFDLRKVRCSKKWARILLRLTEPIYLPRCAAYRFPCCRLVLRDWPVTALAHMSETTMQKFKLFDSLNNDSIMEIVSNPNYKSSSDSTLICRLPQPFLAKAFQRFRRRAQTLFVPSIFSVTHNHCNNEPRNQNELRR